MKNVVLAALALAAAAMIASIAPDLRRYIKISTM
jgi:hypothetical protein